MTRNELETILGAPNDFILSDDNLAHLRAWAETTGLDAASVAIMSGVKLANLYHEHGGKPSEPRATPQQEFMAEMLVKLLDTISVPGFNIGLQRQITREQLQAEIENGGSVRALCIKLLDELAPRRLEIVSPAGMITLNGPMHYMTETVIRHVGIGHPVMMVGPAGCGKTTIGEHTARALGLPFYITSTINETHELTGYRDGFGVYHSTPFRNAFEHGGLWVADEIDAWDASALLAANAALANGYSVFPDAAVPIRRNDNFRMVATANTFGNGADRVYIGRNELDAASLDRFATIEIDYDLTLEQIFAGSNQKWLEHVWHIRKRVTERKIRHVVSSRAILMGARALAAGETWNNCEAFYLFKGMSKSDREKVE